VFMLRYAHEYTKRAVWSVTISKVLTDGGPELPGPSSTFRVFTIREWIVFQVPTGLFSRATGSAARTQTRRCSHYLSAR